MADLAGVIISGGPIQDFREGWAIIPFAHTPHWWRDKTDVGRRRFPDAPADARLFHSLCGRWQGCRESRGIHPLAPGNHKLCRACMRKAPRWARREERRTLLETDPAVRRLFDGVLHNAPSEVDP